MSTPTPEQLANAIAAGWNPDDGEPPDGWDAHGKDPGPVEILDGAGIEIAKDGSDESS